MQHSKAKQPRPCFGQWPAVPRDDRVAAVAGVEAKPSEEQADRYDPDRQVAAARLDELRKGDARSTPAGPDLIA